MRVLVYLGCVWSRILFSGHHSAVTYEFSNGRFGDNLLTYFHAKWISYQAGIPLLYKPFPYAEQLVFSATEGKFEGDYCQEIWLSQTDAKFSKIHQNNTLFHVAYFPELSWGGEHV